LVLLLSIAFGLFFVQAPTALGEGGSLLAPSQALPTQFSYTVSAMDPSAASNPAGATFPGFRGPNQLILYTAGYGAQTTGTSGFGEEVRVVGGLVDEFTGANSLIPNDNPESLILSGHGAAAQWLRKIARRGARVAFDPQSRQLTLRYTPEVYLYQVEAAIARATSRPPADPSAYSQARQEADQCLDTLKQQAETLSEERPTAPYIALAQRCEQLADRAYLATIASRANEYRGVWLRPLAGQDTSVEGIRRTIARLKAYNIRDVYLETYFQGRTLFPSQTMARYGLPEQHNQFRGTDPLKLWIETAHQEGLRVHAWTQVFLAGNVEESIEPFGPILNQYPQWRNVQRVSLNATMPVPSTVEEGHLFVDPANPEVRAYLEALILEIVTRYDVDGLNLDYIRYPASHSVKSGDFFQSTWGYTPVARQRFEAEMRARLLPKPSSPEIAGKKPASRSNNPPAQTPILDPIRLTPSHPYWQAWTDWRKAQISSFVQRISTQVHVVKPSLPISAVVFPKPDPQFALKLQEWPVWVQAGWVQALTPIGLIPTPEGLQRQSQEFRRMTQDKVPVYVGVFGVYNRLRPVEFAEQIDAVRAAGMPGVMLFEWSRMRPEYEEALRLGPFRAEP
jgi:uncharacterized lipoprotein YddW (UPF0748 family)